MRQLCPEWAGLGCLVVIIMYSLKIGYLGMRISGLQTLPASAVWTPPHVDGPALQFLPSGTIYWYRQQAYSDDLIGLTLDFTGEYHPARPP